MPANVHQLPTPYRQEQAVQPDRAGFGALRAELKSRCADEDLAALWSGMGIGERKAVLASARMEPRDALSGIENMSKTDRNAIRGAIHRMSQYANQLRERLEGDRPHPSRELASHARQALAEGNTEAAQHWLALIERGVA